METINCILKDNECYSNPNERKFCTPVGIVLHSTGANNKTLKRYIQPSNSDPNYNELISKLGKNKYGNHWNKSGVYKSAHYFIGEDSNGKVCVVNTLPEEISAWGVGSGKKGSYNYDPTAHIQIECCEDNLTDSEYFSYIYEALVEICADICVRWGFDVSSITTHKQAYLDGYASNHKDIDHWFDKFGATLEGFREDVKMVMQPKYKNFEMTVECNGETYHVRGEYTKLE